ncbi:hypothetical protein IV203_034612 [Nitzschia inconspicua]|uniref:Uncharacterized protein n=1 Tax=Nitzschia inconspicua TaxID=303405 RepID=A0A9K3K9P9_9STRA|nr:hypothetical protein IV203_002672 [Nitzschia inconspicua]KAG7359514.1 hypothetical protein IV203_034612 [Nitzschia inconspicua]
MVPQPKPQEHNAMSSMAIAADSAFQDLIQISSISVEDETNMLKCGDPPLDHIEEDEDSDEEITRPSTPTSPPKAQTHHQHLQTISATSTTTTALVENTRTPVYSSTRRGAGPIDIDAIDDMSGSLDSKQVGQFYGSASIVQALTYHKRITTPVDLDDSVVDDDETTILEHRLPCPVDVDSVQDREDGFSMIWKEYEDEFLVWKGNEQLQVMALKNARARQKAILGRSCRDGGNKRSLALNNNKFLTDEGIQNEASPVFAIKYEGNECKHEDTASDGCGSLDTFGFSLTNASTDSYGFPVKVNKQTIPRGDSTRLEDALNATTVPKNVGSTESSRARTIQRIKDVLSKDQDSEDTGTDVGLGAKARGLRAIRLRSATYHRTQTIQPVFSTVHEHEEWFAWKDTALFPQVSKLEETDAGFPSEERMESFAVYDYPGNYGFVVNVDRDNADMAQSVVSDITNLSDKIFLRVTSVPESKWDDISSVGLNGVEGKPCTIATPAKKDNFLEAKEVVPSSKDIGKPPFYYDASIKTPPFFSCHDLSEDAKVQDEDDKPSIKWDDVSSIGLLGVEGHKTGQKVKPSPGEFHIPVVITSCGTKKIKNNECPSQRSNNFIAKRSSQDIFRSRQESKHLSKTPGVSLNATFSTVWTGDSDTSSASGDFPDPEMQKEPLSSWSSKCMLMFRRKKYWPNRQSFVC